MELMPLSKNTQIHKGTSQKEQTKTCQDNNATNEILKCLKTSIFLKHFVLSTLAEVCFLITRGWQSENVQQICIN